MLRQFYWFAATIFALSCAISTPAIARLTPLSQRQWPPHIPKSDREMLLKNFPATVAQQPENNEIDEAEEHYNFGTTLQERGDLEGALEEYRKALRLNPNLAEAHVNSGVILVNRGEIDRAIEAYETAIEIDPQLPAAHYNLGNALAKNENFFEAIEAYKRAIEILPNYSKAYYNMGNAWVNLGEEDAAIAAYRDAIRIEPEFAEAHANLGIILYQKGQQQEAQMVLTNARDLFELQGNTQSANRVEQILSTIARPDS
jgi:tetratricopeptide (TPR) repeat protein